jgi:hypothetical protein
MNSEEARGQIQLKLVDNPIAQKWYDIGFKFAINYLFFLIPTIMGEGKEFNQDTFRVLVHEAVGDEDNNGEKVIDEDYFNKLHFFDNDNNYGSHQCPDPSDPNVCIPCTTPKIGPVPKP